MKTIDQWKALLRARLRVALAAKDSPALSVVRETLAALENAEAPPMQSTSTRESGPFAGSAAGLGASEVARLALTPEAALAIVERELHDRRAAAADYTRLGRHAEAGALSAQADVLAALLADAH